MKDTTFSVQINGKEYTVAPGQTYFGSGTDL